MGIFDKKHEYEVLKGLEHPRGKAHKVGDVIKLTDEEASKFVEGLIEKVINENAGGSAINQTRGITNAPQKGKDEPQTGGPEVNAKDISAPTPPEPAKDGDDDGEKAEGNKKTGGETPPPPPPPAPTPPTKKEKKDDEPHPNASPKKEVQAPANDRVSRCV